MHQGIKTGQEAMLKKMALVIEDIDPEGKIQYADEIWSATGDGKRFLKGDRVVNGIGAGKATHPGNL